MVRMVARLYVVLSCFLVAFLGGCSGGSQSCIPGLTVVCPCPTGQLGAQTCTSAGTFAACVCSAPALDAGDLGGSDGAATSPSDAAAAGSSIDSAGMGGEGGPVVDAAADQSAPADANLAADAPPDVWSANAFPDAVADAGEGEEASDTTPAIVSFTASATTISAGQSSMLSWAVTGATMLTLDQGVGSALITVLGTTSRIVSPAQTTTFTLTLNGSVSAQVTVTVVPLPSIASFYASPGVVNPGGNSTLTAVFSGGTGTVDQDIGVVISGVGVSTGPISATTTYTLTVTNAVGGSTTAQVTVVPAGPSPVNGLAVWVTQKTTGGTGQISLNFRIDNETSQIVDMSTVTLRYWYQDEGLGTALLLAANYVRIGYSNQGKVTLNEVVAVSPAVPGANHYLELSFAGTLAPQGDKNTEGLLSTNDQFNIQVTLHTASFTGGVDVTNDYSYGNGAAGVYEQKITLYDQSGKLIWGVEPG